MLAAREGYVHAVSMLVESGASADVVSVLVLFASPRLLSLPIVIVGREGITATDIAFVAKNSPMLMVLPAGSKGKGDSMQAAVTVRAGGNAFPIQFSYVSGHAPHPVARLLPAIFSPVTLWLTCRAALGTYGGDRRRRGRQGFPRQDEQGSGCCEAKRAGGCEATQWGWQIMLHNTLSGGRVASCAPPCHPATGPVRLQPAFAAFRDARRVHAVPMHVQRRGRGAGRGAAGSSDAGGVLPCAGRCRRWLLSGSLNL